MLAHKSKVPIRFNLDREVEQIDKAIHKLSVQHQALIYATYYHGLSIRAVSRFMEMSRSKTHREIRKAIVSISDHL